MWSDDDECFSYSPYYCGSIDEDMDSDDSYFEEEDCSESDEESRIYRDLLFGRCQKIKEVNDEDAASSSDTPVYQVRSLQESCSRFIASTFPFEYIEHRDPPIPDELQLKIIQFSFPEDERMIRKFAEFSRSNVDFDKATRIYENGSVKDLKQIGFRLSASVYGGRGRIRRSNEEKYYVSIHFDRGKVTSAYCSCEESTNWCEHAIATCLARINNNEKTTIHLPISDSLNLLNREQLLKFAQYLLCDYQNERVVESAQHLLDKLLLRGQNKKGEDINNIAGAPDPTAGPGLDEEAHWFVSKSGLKSRCQSLMYDSWAELGFVMNTDDDRGKSVCEAWRANLLKPFLISDELDQEIDRDHVIYGYSYRQRDNLLQVLGTMVDLLQDDFMSAVSALSMCTEQLVERLDKLCEGRSPTKYHYEHSSIRKQERSPNNTMRAGGSSAGNYTPRISSCRTLIDELSRLWRLVVLSPRLPARQRTGIISQLKVFSEKVSKTMESDLVRLNPWEGLKVAVRLSMVNWSAVEFQRVLCGEWLHFPVVCSRMTIHFNYQWKQSDSSHESMRMDVDSGSCDILSPLESEVDKLCVGYLYHPHCISFGPHWAVDIHSLCSIIEALKLSGDLRRAVRLAVAVSCSLLSFCKNLLCGNIDIEAIPVSAKCFLGLADKKVSRPHESVATGMVVDEGRRDENISYVWPEDTVLSITTFAFIFEFLTEASDLVDACLVEMRNKSTLPCSAVEHESIADCLSNAQSLKFQLGIFGLFMDRLPAPCQRSEVEQFDTECWLTYRLIGSSPTHGDLKLLTLLGRQIIGKRALHSLSPAYSLVRVIFSHLFKLAPVVLSEASFTNDQMLAIDVALGVLRHEDRLVKTPGTVAWMLFQYANCRLWAKLAKIVLLSLSDCEEFLEKAMSCILKPNGLVGVPSAEKQSLNASEELMEAKGRVVYSLAKTLSLTKGNLKEKNYSPEKRKSHQQTSLSPLAAFMVSEDDQLEMPKQIMKARVKKALNLCVVRIGAHSVFMQSVGRQGSRNETVRWLTEFAVNSGIDCVNCLVKFGGGVQTLFKQREALDFCDKILKRKDEQLTGTVEEILLSQLKNASQSESSEDMKAVVLFCRENHYASEVDLLPRICRELQSFQPQGFFLPFEVLMHASETMFNHYKRRLEKSDDSEVRRAQEGPLYLGRLFDPERSPGDNSDKEEVNQNPYRTSEAHPFLETAFELGIAGIEKLSKSGVQAHEEIPYYRSPIQQLEKFCKLVCYLVEKKWLDSSETEIPTRIIRSLRRGIPRTESVEPSCSSAGSDPSTSLDNRYLNKFVSSLINAVDNPLWLFNVLQELADNLAITSGSERHWRASSREEIANSHMREAFQTYPSVRLLLQRVLGAFSELLLGPKMAALVEDFNEHNRRRNRRRPEPSEASFDLGHKSLLNTRLKEVLRTAKRAFILMHPDGSTFKDLTNAIKSQHSVMEPLLESVARDKDSDNEERRFFIEPRSNVLLPEIFAQALLPRFLLDSSFGDFL